MFTSKSKIINTCLALVVIIVCSMFLSSCSRDIYDDGYTDTKRIKETYTEAITFRNANLVKEKDSDYYFYSLYSRSNTILKLSEFEGKELLDEEIVGETPVRFDRSDALLLMGGNSEGQTIIECFRVASSRLGQTGSLSWSKVLTIVVSDFEMTSLNFEGIGQGNVTDTEEEYKSIYISGKKDNLATVNSYTFDRDYNIVTETSTVVDSENRYALSVLPYSDGVVKFTAICGDIDTTEEQKYHYQKYVSVNNDFEIIDQIAMDEKSRFNYTSAYIGPINCMIYSLAKDKMYRYSVDTNTGMFDKTEYKIVYDDSSKNFERISHSFKNGVIYLPKSNNDFEIYCRYYCLGYTTFTSYDTERECLVIQTLADIGREDKIANFFAGYRTRIPMIYEDYLSMTIYRNRIITNSGDYQVPGVNKYPGGKY